MNKLIIQLVSLLFIVGCSGTPKTEWSQWNGRSRYDFGFENRQATIVFSDKAAEGNPWIFRPAFFAAFPNADIALLDSGFHVVYLDLTHSYGSPKARVIFNLFYESVIKEYDLSSKMVVEGLSRGSLWAFNWAADNPDRVACIYVDNPVCNPLEWPSRNNRKLWRQYLRETGITNIEADTFKGIPLHNAFRIAKAHIPVLLVCGDSDKTVNFENNGRAMYDSLTKYNGVVELIVKPGADHHPHGLDNPQPIIDFIYKHVRK